MLSLRLLKISIILALVASGGFGCASIAFAQSELTRSLSLGARGNDVKYLQEFLAKDPKIYYPEGLITGYFGPRTREAVKKWQQKNGIDAIGIVGPKTIAKIKEVGRATVVKENSPTASEPSQTETAAASPDAAAPSNTAAPEATLSVSVPAPASVYIEFTPNKEVIAVYEYGLTTKYGSTQEVWNQYFSSPTGTYIENLIPATTYQIRAKVTDRDGNIGYSQNHTFTTPSLEQAAIISSGPSVSPTSALPAVAVTINWSTNIPCTGTLYYGGDATFGNAQTSGYTAKHTVTITGLAPGANYVYKITCATKDKTLDSSKDSSNYTFTATSSASSADSRWPLASVLQILIDLIKKIKF